MAGYLDKKYIILGFDNFDGCISAFTPRVCKNIQFIPICKVEVFGNNKIIGKGRAKALPLLVV